MIVNDVHSQLNRTNVSRIERSASLKQLQRFIRQNEKVCIAGCRHAMGSQQFAEKTVLIDLTGLNRVLSLNRKDKTVTVHAGIQWPKLIRFLNKNSGWTIAQKQTGADNLSLGGALSSNVHGRGLKMKPIIDDVESFQLVNYEGELVNCSRTQNPELFRLAIGGYGLFGVFCAITLKLVGRKKMERVVKLAGIKEVPGLFKKRIEEGFEYGDFQFSTDEKSHDFLSEGVFSAYRPAKDSARIPKNQKKLSEQDWKKLHVLSHVDKRKAFSIYVSHYLSTSGQIYWSDSVQLSTYIDNYHKAIDKITGYKGTEMITEIYVPMEKLVDFMNKAKDYFLKNGINVIYGTIRIIEKDEESFLAWAKREYACIIFNLHIDHNPVDVAKNERALRKLISLGLKFKGSYFLTYHKYASKKQVEACYPDFRDFLRLKKKYDPEEKFQSEWYRHHKKIFGLK